MKLSLPPELSLSQVEAAAVRLKPWVRQTPSFDWHRSFLADHDISVSVKFELWQVTHSFKPRGALNVLLNTPPEQLNNGVTAMSGGNHAIAVAYAAKMLGYTVKVVIPKTASPLRRERCEGFGAEVILAEDMLDAYAKVDAIVAQEGRLRVHPFEGVYTSQGTATIGLEWLAQAGQFDTVIIPIGGGGLISGIAAVLKQLNPACRIIGVEPIGAPTLFEARQANNLVKIKLNTIADSLSAPYAMPFSFELIQQIVDDLVLISDAEMVAAMKIIWEEWQLMVEPACAAATAGLLHLKDHLRGKRVGIIFCGSNIDPEKWLQLAFA